MRTFARFYDVIEKGLLLYVHWINKHIYTYTITWFGLLPFRFLHLTSCLSKLSFKRKQGGLLAPYSPSRHHQLFPGAYLNVYFIIYPRRACTVRVTVDWSVFLSVCVSAQHLTSRASFRLENHITHTTGNKAQNNCVDFCSVAEIHHFLHCMATIGRPFCMWE